jgi:two-component system sensor histidine kinase KdpD
MLVSQKGQVAVGALHGFNLDDEVSAPLLPQEARRLRAALLDSISRDIARPLALIAGAAASLRNRRAASDASVRNELIEVIEDETDRVERFASLLLDMARLECDGIEIQPENVALAEVVSSALNDAASALRKHKIDMNVPADLPGLRVDPAILRRVLVLLVDNAARQSPPGSTISVHAGRDRTAVRLQVLDEGDGISPADIPGVFNQFSLPCTDEEKYRGGMNLAVCRGYIESMGGTIAASNRTDGGGSVFTITFPLAA